MFSYLLLTQGIGKGAKHLIAMEPSPAPWCLYNLPSDFDSAYRRSDRLETSVDHLET